MNDSPLYKIEQPSVSMLSVILLGMLFVTLFFAHGVYSNVLYFQMCYLSGDAAADAMCQAANAPNGGSYLISFAIGMIVFTGATLLMAYAVWNITRRFSENSPVLQLYETKISYDNIFGRKANSIQVEDISTIKLTPFLMSVKVKGQKLRKLILMVAPKLDEGDIAKTKAILEDYKKTNPDLVTEYND